jgi:hypothetical protein
MIENFIRIGWGIRPKSFQPAVFLQDGKELVPAADIPRCELEIEHLA